MRTQALRNSRHSLKIQETIGRWHTELIHTRLVAGSSGSNIQKSQNCNWQCWQPHRTGNKQEFVSAKDAKWNSISIRRARDCQTPANSQGQMLEAIVNHP